MKEGFLVIVVRITSVWPPQSKYIICSKMQNGSKITIEATRKGTMVFSVNQLNEKIINYQTQVLKILNKGFLGIIFTWKNSNVKLSINGLEIKSLLNSKGSELLVETKEYTLEASPSITHPDAEKICKPWMEWRKNRFANPKSLSLKGEFVFFGVVFFSIFFVIF